MPRNHVPSRIPPAPRDGGSYTFRQGMWVSDAEIEAEENWTDADEAALEDYEEQRRQRIAEANEH